MLGLILCAALDTAPYATVDELGGDGAPHQVDLSMFVSGLRIPDAPNGLRTIATFGLHERTLVGRTVGYALGFDGSVGGSSTGATYGGTIYPVGLGVRFDGGGSLTLAGGIGADRVVGAVPLAARVPAELSLVLSLGVVRPTLFVRPSWLFGADERKRGARTLSSLDELEAGISVRFGAQHRYWSQTNAGRGPVLGVVYRELLGARAVGLTLGLDLSGGR